MNQKLGQLSEKIQQPQDHYQSPIEVANDETLNKEEKRHALKTWEQDARQLLTASNEGMPEGPDHKLGEVLRAKEELENLQKDKPSH
jgi:hypothetical protein